MPRSVPIIVAIAVLLGVAPACAGSLVEPSLHLRPTGQPGRHVALTLDACGGATDNRILSVLIDNGIPATIFVTGKWLRRNPEAVAIIKAHPGLLQVENHGESHIPAIDHPVRVYGIASAGSPEAVRAEVEHGARDIAAAGLPAPVWFRGATAQYSPSAVALIRQLGFKVAGYSINGDGGALLGAATVDRRVAAAKDGDVIIAHINQPKRPAGAGLVSGLLRLQAEGVTFVRLSDIDEDGSDDTTG